MAMPWAWNQLRTYLQFKRRTLISDMMDSIQRLEQDCASARKYGIAQLGASYRPSTDVCKQMNKTIGTLMNRIKNNTYVSQLPFENGSKAFVVGVPYKPFPHSKNNIWVTHMSEDKNRDRANEINFKQQLVKLYNEKYLNENPTS